MLKYLFLMVLMFAQSSFANRTVAIATPEGKLTLINGSAVTVTYSVECFDKVTATNVLTGASNVTLQPKKSIDFVSAGSCANGNPSGSLSSGVVACPGSVNFSSAASLCGPNTPLCTYDQIFVKAPSNMNILPNSYWFEFQSSNTFYTTWDSWTSNTSQTVTGGGKNHQMAVYNKQASNKCSATTSGGVSYCSAQDVNNTLSGALCCPTNNGFKSCTVTIHSTTPATGFLQSPQFKGSAAF